MDKLQLYITMSLDKYKNLVDINPDEYIKSWVCDLREVVCQVDYPQNEKAIFYLIKYIDSGVFIVVLRTIPRELGHHLASWIFIPYSIKISDKDVCDIVNFITRKVSNDSVDTKDIAEIRERFSHVYPTNALAPSFAPSQGLQYAYRYYGPGTGINLDELIGIYRYQPCYLSFSGVLFVDRQVTSDIAGTNITSAPLERMGVLMPPAKLDIDGYRPTIYGEDFDVPYFAPMERSIDVIWHKDGAPDQKQPITLNLPEMRTPDLILANGPLRPSSFTADRQRPKIEASHTPQRTSSLPEPKQPLPWDDPKPEIANNKPKPTTDSNPVHATSARTATTSARPWADNKGKEVESKQEEKETPKQAPKLERSDLPERQKVYKFEIPTKSAAIGSVIQFVITTDSRLEESPIDGYEADTIYEGSAHSNRLHYKGDSAKMALKAKAIYAAAGFVLGILMMLLFKCSGGEKSESSAADIDSIPTTEEVIANQESKVDKNKSDKNKDSKKDKDNKENKADEAKQTEGQDTKAVATGEYSYENAIKYLDSNKRWTKEDMEKYPDLTGLFDDMNSINRDRLMNVWASKLKESRVFTNTVIKHVKIGEHKTPRKKPYTTGQSIHIQEYINTVDP